MARAAREAALCCVVVPWLSPNDADSKIVADLAAARYRFVPLLAPRAHLAGIHGVDKGGGAGAYRVMLGACRGVIRAVDEADAREEA